MPDKPYTLKELISKLPVGICAGWPQEIAARVTTLLVSCADRLDPKHISLINAVRDFISDQRQPLEANAGNTNPAAPDTLKGLLLWACDRLRMHGETTGVLYQLLSVAAWAPGTAGIRLSDLKNGPTKEVAPSPEEVGRGLQLELDKAQKQGRGAALAGHSIAHNPWSSDPQNPRWAAWRKGWDEQQVILDPKSCNPRGPHGIYELWHCNPENGIDYISDSGFDQPALRSRMRADVHQLNRDAWLIWPNGTKELPDGTTLSKEAQLEARTLPKTPRDALTDLESIREAGCRAKRDGKALTDCPYPANSADLQYMAWRQGYVGSEPAYARIGALVRLKHDINAVGTRYAAGSLGHILDINASAAEYAPDSSGREFTVVIDCVTTKLQAPETYFEVLPDAKPVEYGHLGGKGASVPHPAPESTTIDGVSVLDLLKEGQVIIEEAYQQPLLDFAQKAYQALPSMLELVPAVNLPEFIELLRTMLPSPNARAEVKAAEMCKAVRAAAPVQSHSFTKGDLVEAVIVPPNCRLKKGMLGIFQGPSQFKGEIVVKFEVPGETMYWDITPDCIKPASEETTRIAQAWSHAETAYQCPESKLLRIKTPYFVGTPEYDAWMVGLKAGLASQVAKQPEGLQRVELPPGTTLMTEFEWMHDQENPEAKEDKAYVEGQAAYRRGDLSNKCPYSVGTPEGAAWIRGWDNPHTPAIAVPPAQGLAHINPDKLDRALIIQDIQRTKAAKGTPAVSWTVSEEEIEDWLKRAKARWSVQQQDLQRVKSQAQKVVEAPGKLVDPAIAKARETIRNSPALRGAAIGGAAGLLAAAESVGLGPDSPTRPILGGPAVGGARKHFEKACQQHAAATARDLARHQDAVNVHVSTYDSKGAHLATWHHTCPNLDDAYLRYGVECPEVVSTDMDDWVKAIHGDITLQNVPELMSWGPLTEGKVLTLHTNDGIQRVVWNMQTSTIKPFDDTPRNLLSCPKCQSKLAQVNYEAVEDDSVLTGLKVVINEAKCSLCGHKWKP